MKERPILFSAPMVRAILYGSKTQTRRVYKVRKHPDAGCEIAASELAREPQHVIYRICPYGQPGDGLWAKETFWAYGRWETGSGARMMETLSKFAGRHKYGSGFSDYPLQLGHTRPDLVLHNCSSFKSRLSMLRSMRTRKVFGNFAEQHLNSSQMTKCRSKVVSAPIWKRLQDNQGLGVYIKAQGLNQIQHSNGFANFSVAFFHFINPSKNWLQTGLNFHDREMQSHCCNFRPCQPLLTTQIRLPKRQPECDYNSTNSSYCSKYVPQIPLRCPWQSVITKQKYQCKSRECAARFKHQQAFFHHIPRKWEGILA